MKVTRPNLFPAGNSAHRALPAACVLFLALAALLWSPIASRGDLQSQVHARSITAAQLRAAITAETRRIEATSAGVRRAEARLADLQAQAQARQTRLIAVQQSLVRARARLTRLINRMRLASSVLGRNLVAAYKVDRPDVTTVVLEARGFADLLERLEFARRVGEQNAEILRATRRSRLAVLRQTNELQAIEGRMQALTAQLVAARNQAAAVHGALLGRKVALVNSRATTRAKLARVRTRIASLRARIAHVQQQALRAPGPLGADAKLPVNAGGTAQPSGNAPGAVAQVIAAGNAIAGLPYVYGGGHASFKANAYDCSGSVSYALAAAGLLSSPLNSTGFMSWGEPGPGKWITVYANAGHAFMVIDGWRFDTSALRGGGTRFTKEMRPAGGFVARHPPGL